MLRSSTSMPTRARACLMYSAVRGTSGCTGGKVSPTLKRMLPAPRLSPASSRIALALATSYGYWGTPWVV